MDLTPTKIMQTGFAFWSSKVLLSAVEIEVFTELAGQSRDLASLQDRLGLHPRGARDFLDALVALGFLLREEGRYANTPETDFFLDKAKPSYIGGILEMANHRLFSSWNRLTEALRTGEQQNETQGEAEPFAALYADPARLKEFLRAMSGVSRIPNQAIARQFPWTDYTSFVDVGTAQGDLAVQIARVHPHLRGIGFDLPAVRPIFEDYVAQNQLADRITFVGSDFFAAFIPKADVVLMGHILHDWNLGQKRQLLAKAYEALATGGAVVVYDAVIDDDRSQNAFGLTMSLNMLIETPGGFDYTGEDCMGWMREAGFRETRVEPLPGPNSMVVGIK